MVKSKAKGMRTLKCIDELYQHQFITQAQKIELAMLTSKAMGGNDRLWDVIAMKLRAISTNTNPPQKSELISQCLAAVQ